MHMSVVSKCLVTGPATLARYGDCLNTVTVTVTVTTCQARQATL